MSEKLSKSEIQTKFASLNERRANIIAEVMRLRHEQAQIKADLAGLAAKSGDPSMVANIIACW